MVCDILCSTRNGVTNHNILEPIPSTAKRQTEWDLGTKFNKSCDQRRDHVIVNIQSCVLLEIFLCLVQVQHLTCYFAPQEQQLVKTAQGKGKLLNKVSVAYWSGPWT